MYPQPSLPFDPTRPTQPPMQIDVNNPPFTPDYRCEEGLMPFRQYFAGLLIMEIQNGLNRQNPLRIFAFNLFSANGWRNEDFSFIFGKACDYIALSLLNREFRSPDEAAIQLIPRFMKMIVAENTNLFPELVRYIDQEQWGAVQQQCAMWARVRGAIDLFRSRNPIWGYGQQQQMSPHMQRPYVDPRQPMMDPRAQYRSLAAHQLGAAAGGMGGAMPMASGGMPSHIDPRLLGTGLGEPVVAARRDNPYARMMAQEQEAEAKQATQALETLRPPFNVRTPKEEPTMQQSNVTPQVSELEDGSILIPEATSTYHWQPTEEQPARPAYHPSTQERFHRVMPDGTVYIEVHDKVNMDFEEHNLPHSIFGKAREGVTYDIARANQAFGRGAQEFANRMDWTIKARQLGDTDEGRQAQEKANEEPASVITVEDDWLCEVSEVSLMVTTGISRAEYAAKAQKSPDVFRRYAFVSEPVICETDQSDFLRRLADSRSWLELAGKIEAGLKENDIGFVEAVTRRAIVTLNRVLALHMSVPPEMISLGTDFDVATIQELESALEGMFSSVFVSAYKKHQRKHILSMFQSIGDGEIEKNLRDSFIDPSKFPEGKAPWLGLLTSCMSFTTLDMYARDLDLELDPETGSLLTKENSGDLHTVMADLFARMPKDRTFAKHLLQTNDGVLLEVVEGDLVPDAYMLARVAQVWFG